MNKKECYLELEIMLDAELAHANALIDLLKNEGETLPKEADTLIEISTQKNCLMKKLEQYHTHRTALIKTLGFNTDLQGFKDCIAWCDRNNNLQSKFNRYTEQVKTCKTLNQLNGSVMDSSLRVVKQALSILYGQQINEDTYNATGQAESGNRGRSIAKA